MNKVLPWLAILTSGLLSAGCEVLNSAPEPTPLQIQSFQTKEFETTKAVALAAVINVFQDLGYIIQSADKDTGFITAISPSKSNTGLLDALSGTSTSGVTKATAFLEEIRPSFTTVRLNFVKSQRSSSEQGQYSEHDTAVLDPQTYQIAFNKIDDAIFVRVGTAPSAAQSKQP